MLKLTLTFGNKFRLQNTKHLLASKYGSRERIEVILMMLLNIFSEIISTNSFKYLGLGRM